MLIIGGVDYSDAMNKYTYTVTYEQREGGNGGLAKDGSMILDILAYKAVITFETNGLKGADLAAMVSSLEGDFLPVTFTDPKTNSTRTAEFHASVGELSTAMWKGGNVTWYKATEITLTER